MPTLPVDKIMVGKRRREEYGDIDGLSDSMKRFGLLHPVVVDADQRLVVGGRRLEAAKKLGWTEIPVRFLGDLSENELREIELEENLRRKDLSEYERSKNMVELAEAAVEVDREQARGILGNDSPKTRGRPIEPGSQRRAAERIGVDHKTISNAKQHVEAADKYPELKSWPKMDAIQGAKYLDGLSEQERQDTLEKLADGDSDTMTRVAGKPPMPKDSKTLKQRLEENPRYWFAKALERFYVAASSVNHAGGIEEVVARMGVDERKGAEEQVERAIFLLEEWLETIHDAPTIRRVH